MSDMSRLLGKDMTVTKILPILQELLKDDNSEVKLNVVYGLLKIAKVIGFEQLLSVQIMQTLANMTKDGQWRVRMAVFELIADLAVTR